MLSTRKLVAAVALAATAGLVALTATVAVAAPKPATRAVPKPAAKAKVAAKAKAAAPVAAAPEAIRVVVQDVAAPEGSTPASQPVFVGPNGAGAASLFSAKVGVPVVLTIVNESTTMHTFSVPSLNVNAIVGVGATVTVKFTPTAASDAVQWLCAVPCGSYVMAQMGAMKGTIKVTKA